VGEGSSGNGCIRREPFAREQNPHRRLFDSRPRRAGRGASRRRPLHHHRGTGVSYPRGGTGMSYSKDELNRRMDGAVATVKSELNGLRTGRASAALLDPVKVEAYGNISPINQVGTVGTPEPRLITVQVWDKGLVKAVDKAIR